MKRFLMMLAGLAALTVYVVPDAKAQRLKRDVGPNTNPVYERECGSCHFPHQAGWLPERSWSAIMASLGAHFGESLTLSPSARENIAAYLLANSAERQQSLRSIQVIASIKPGETPGRVSQVPYVSGIHGGFLDPAYGARPKLSSFANCTACHGRAAAGVFTAVQYTVSDESFRSSEPSYASVLSPAELLVMRKK